MNNRTARRGSARRASAQRASALHALAAVALFAAPGAVRAADEPARPALPPRLHASEIEVVDATYGARRMVVGCSATEFVTRLCNGKTQCEMPVSDAVCGGSQPATAVLISTLVVRYRCFPGDIPRAASKERPFTLRVSCRGVGR